MDNPTSSFGTMGIMLVILAILIGVIIAVLLVRARRKGNKKESSGAGIGAAVSSVTQPGELPGSFVKRCPTCRGIFADETLAFCLSDGSTLERIPNPSLPHDPSATLVYPNVNQSDLPPTVQYHPDTSSGNKG